MKRHLPRWWRAPRQRTSRLEDFMNAAQPVRDELDSLAHLEERITRAVELVSHLRAQNAALEEQLTAAVSDRNAAIADRDTARAELDALRSERKQVRTRIEKLLG